MKSIVTSPWVIGERTKDEYSDFIAVQTSGKYPDRDHPDFVPKHDFNVLLVEKNVSNLTEREFQDCVHLAAAAPEMYALLQDLYLHTTDGDMAAKIHAMLRHARGRK